MPALPEGVAAASCQDTPTTSFEVGGGASSTEEVASHPARLSAKRMSVASLQTSGELDSINAQLEMMRVQSESAAATLATITSNAEVRRPCMVSCVSFATLANTWSPRDDFVSMQAGE